MNQLIAAAILSCLEFNVECGFFTYLDNNVFSVGEIATGTASRVKVVPEEGKTIHGFYHMHPNDLPPLPSTLDTRFAFSISHQAPTKFFVFNRNGIVYEYTPKTMN